MKAKVLFSFLSILAFLTNILIPNQYFLTLIFSIVPLLITYLVYKPNLLNLHCIVASTLLVQGLVGLQMFNGNRIAEGTSLTYQLPREYAPNTFLIFLLSSSVMFLFGIGESRISLDFDSLRSITLSFRMELLLLVPALGVVVSGGISNLLSRNSHLYGEKDSIFTHIFSLLSLIAPAILAFLGRGSRGYRKFRLSVYILIYILLFFSLGSRKLAFGILMLFLLPRMKSAPLRIAWYILGIMASLSSISLSLYLRSLKDQGLLSYLQNFQDFKISTSISDVALGNVVGGFPITGISAFLLPKYPKWHLLVEINPLWGGPAGWYRIAPFHSINSYTPSSGLGDLWNYGPVIFCLFWIVLGICLLKIQTSLDLTASPGSVLYSAYGLSLLFFASSVTQYSLRSSLRAIYYVIFLQFVWIGISKMFPPNISTQLRKFRLES